MKKLLAVLLTLALLFSLTACNNNTSEENANSNEQAQTESDNKSDEGSESNTGGENASNENSEADSKEDKSASSEEPAEKPLIKVGVLKGPTGFGMSKLIDNVETGSVAINAEFEVFPTPDKIVPMIVQGKLDFACVPTNLASILYNKTGGEVKMCAVNTLGVLHLVGNSENAEKIKSMADLKGMELYSSGKGAVPEFLVNKLLTDNGIDLENDINVEYMANHQELATAVTSGEKGLAVLPQPFVTIATMKGKDVKHILDLNDEWAKKYPDTPITTGCIIVKKELLESNPEYVDEFLAAYKDSIDWVNANAADASVLIEKQKIFPKAKVAEKAIPNCSIVYMDKEEAKNSVNAFLNVLFEANPKSVGGKMPADDFYK